MPRLLNTVMAVALLAVPTSILHADTNCLSCASGFDGAALVPAFDKYSVAPVPFIRFSLAFPPIGLALKMHSMPTVYDGSWNVIANRSRTKFDQSAISYATFLGRQPRPDQNATASRDRVSADVSLPREADETDRIRFGIASLAPMAFVRFCLRYPRDCQGQKEKMPGNNAPLTASQLKELTQVNRDVNRAIRPQANDGGVMAEEWVLSPRSGGCTDYAVSKRHALLARGWPANSLLLAEVVVLSGEHHLVLVVRTDEGDLVLDNLNRNILKVSQTDYQWVRAQSTNNPKFWATITVDRITRTALARR